MQNRRTPRIHSRFLQGGTAGGKGFLRGILGVVGGRDYENSNEPARYTRRNALRKVSSGSHDLKKSYFEVGEADSKFKRINIRQSQRYRTISRNTIREYSGHDKVFLRLRIEGAIVMDTSEKTH